MTVESLLARVAELEAAYRVWAAPINTAVKPRAGGEPLAAVLQRGREAERAQRQRDDPHPAMFACIDDLVCAYAGADAASRAAMRAAVARTRGFANAVLGYAYRMSERVRAQRDVGALQRGLVALSIENCSRDYRDVLLALAELWVAAEAIGIEPRPAFEAAAELSSREQSLGQPRPMHELLAGFGAMAVLQERRAREPRRRS